MAEAKSFTLSEVSEHNKPEDLYIIIDIKVYNCTSFIQKHPYVVSTSLAEGTRRKLTRHTAVAKR